VAKYILRLDDLGRFSNLDNWKTIFEICIQNNVRPVVGIIPNCTDKKLDNGIENSDKDFWRFINVFRNKIDIALHGYNHENLSEMEFDAQFSTLAKSYKMFVKHDIFPEILIPPNHFFDENTFNAMYHLRLNYLSDGVGLYPWKNLKHEIIQVPQIFWDFRNVPVGISTFCYHPDTMGWFDLAYMGKFIRRNKDKFISITEAPLTPMEILNIPFKYIYAFLYKRKFGKPINI
jgi:hypothetical protein